MSMLDSAAVAAMVHVKVDTVHWYHKKGLMPPADDYFGRSPVWKTETIEAWIEKRAIRKATLYQTEDTP